MKFDAAFEAVLGNEGDLSEDPNDPGGLTRWGISARSYPNLNIRTLTREQAEAIYLADFWCRIHAERLPDLAVFQAFDFAVHSGIQTSIRYLQRALDVADDGYWGPVTQAAAAKANPAALTLRLLAERLDFMRRLSKWDTQGRGWAGRIANDLRIAATELEKAPTA